MKHSKVRIRLIPLSTIFVGGIFLALIVGAACCIFDAYIGLLNTESKHLIYEAATSPAHHSGQQNARWFAALAIQRDFPSELLITFIDDRERITVLQHRETVGPSQPSVIVRDRDDRSGEPASKDPFARLILGSAAIAGLQIQRAHIDNIDIYVKDNDPVFVANISARMPAFFLAVVAGLIVSYILGNLLARQALQPLVEVTFALESLSEGDFEPRTIFTSPKGTLARLARAYNMAGITVENAISERDRANWAMRKFASDAGHQLKTPLTIVRARLGILASNPDEQIGQHEKSISVIDRQCSLMSELLENLMLLDRWEQEAEHSVPLPVDIISLLADMIFVLGDTYPGRSLTLHNDAGERALVHIEPREFTFMITNVIDNALKYTQGSIQARTTLTGGKIVISVEDDGPGMPEAIRERVFDRFFRGLRRDIDGSGLGLSIARAAIERANGIITLNGTEKNGTLVTMTLPLAAHRDAK